MVSFSHWGIFDVPRPPFIVPLGFKVDPDEFRKQWLKPDGCIHLVPADEGDPGQIFFDDWATL